MTHLALALCLALLSAAALRARRLAREEREQHATREGAELWRRAAALAEREEYRPPRLSEIRRPRGWETVEMQPVDLPRRPSLRSLGGGRS